MRRRFRSTVSSISRRRASTAVRCVSGIRREKGNSPLVESIWCCSNTAIGGFGSSVSSCAMS
eukprot:12350827-Heterocapsa_arctica.AAC.1